MSEPSDFIVAIGASAGGLTAIRTLLAELPADFDAPVVIGSHGNEQSILIDALRSTSAMPIETAVDGATLEKSHVYVLPPACHGMFRQGSIRVSQTVRDSGFRPSIDALFMTLACEHGPRAIAVVLSGMMSDGMRGAQVIYDMGGRTIVQDPDEARQASMPRQVILNDHPREIGPADELGRWLVSTVGRSSGG